MKSPIKTRVVVLKYSLNQDLMKNDGDAFVPSQAGGKLFNAGNIARAMWVYGFDNDLPRARQPHESRKNLIYGKAVRRARKEKIAERDYFAVPSGW